MSTRIELAKTLFASLALASSVLWEGPARGAQWELDLETGAAWNTGNDVQIPGDTGTRFSLAEDFDADPALYWRGQAFYRWGERNTLRLLAAPLRIESSGRARAEIRFDDAVFPPGTELAGRYRFDSYRLTYRRDMIHRGDRILGLGVTAKIRDAAIRVASSDVVAEKSNVGFVPLLNVSLLWPIRPRLQIDVDADALAAPQGRAEDVFAGLRIRLAETAHARLGYRILEGGADNDEVYNFALIHYLAAAFALRF